MSVADDANRTSDTVAGEASPPSSTGLMALGSRLRPHLAAGLPAVITVGLMLVWAVHDGGFDDDTWYWGALVLVALAATLITTAGVSLRSLSRPVAVALALFAAYALWSYASMTWAQVPGLALNGSNRTLLYVAMFTVAVLIPWSEESALAALLTFAIGLGVIAVVLLYRLASADDVASLLSAGRMNSPTGYYNATAALFTVDALICIALAARRGLPGPLRGALVAFAGAALQMAVAGQSRGWLFTLPIVVALVALVAHHRLRMALAALLPAVITLIPLRSLLRIYDTASGPALNPTAQHAGRLSLMLVAGAFVLATLVAWLDQLGRTPSPGIRARRMIGATVVGVIIVCGAGGAVAVSHGSPLQFVARQWRGFSHPQTVTTGSHFDDVGSGRYDFWRVALDAFASHPVGGLGQDNFEDYYLPRRRTSEDPAWTHSLELRLLAHTGAVGFLLFAGFLAAALTGALRGRRRGSELQRTIAAASLFPLIVWVVYGSIDWFWEIPALSGPALGFLGLAAVIARRTGTTGRSDTEAIRPPRRLVRRTGGGGLAVAMLVVVVGVLAFPYLAVREVSMADDVQATDPRAALADFHTAAQLNPLSPVPGRLAGALALSIGDPATAAARFRQSISEEPGSWFGWLGAGLAASALGHRQAARHDFDVAYEINPTQPAVAQARARVDTRNPLTAPQAFGLLTIQ